MGKLNFRGYLILRFYPTREIPEKCVLQYDLWSVINGMTTSRTIGVPLNTNITEPESIQRFQTSTEEGDQRRPMGLVAREGLY